MNFRIKKELCTCKLQRGPFLSTFKFTRFLHFCSTFFLPIVALYGGRKKVPISFHFAELRYRSFYFFLSCTCTFFSCAFYSNALTYLISTPFSTEREGALFIFTHVTEGFYAAVDVSLVCTLFFSVPLLIYHIYSFFMPSCYQRERSKLNVLILSALLLFLFSLYMAASFLLPKICLFLQQFQYSSRSMEIKLQARIGPAVRWSCTTFLFTAFFFQMPVLLSLLLSWGAVDCHYLGEKRRYAFFCILLFSSLFSPPDVSSQCVLALGVFLLYELFLWSALFHHRWSQGSPF